MQTLLTAFLLFIGIMALIYIALLLVSKWGKKDLEKKNKKDQ